MLNLKHDIKFLPGMGPKKADVLFNELKIKTFEDLLYHFPYKHTDRTKFYSIRELSPDLPYIQIKGRIISFTEVGEGFKKRLTAQFADGTGIIELVWFKGAKWITQTYKTNTEYIVYGKPNLFGSSFNIAHPEIEEPSKTEQQGIKSALQPFYNTSEKMKDFFLTSRNIHKYIGVILKQFLPEIEETLPVYLTQKLNLLPLQEAMLNIHYPQSAELLKKAELRLKFEELFVIQLSLLRNKVNRESTKSALIFEKVGDFLNNFYKNNLKFELTNAQKRVIKEIRVDLGSGKQMNRLLQGDVGSGKTLVGLMVMLIALDNGFQACLMAPTEILATQHFNSISRIIQGLNINISLLTGSTKKKERTEIHNQLLNGNLHILIGTHALLEDVVQFNNLGLVIIDEQHRFGVAQRARLWQKNLTPPHVLVMTATPIPRTLAMTVYGDLDVSVIDELPPGRKPIKTIHVYENKRLQTNEFLKKEIALGRQVYFVFPLIKESEKFDYEALEEGYQRIAMAFPPPQYNIAVVHGKLKNTEKEAAMQAFISKQCQLMVATTVIEVGVDVPNASVMVIESAERFGLSQLHQLRGRVGRGAEQSFCILASGYKLSEEGRKRLQLMVDSTDGFVIAEADLKLRGPGDIEGTQQSGIPFNLHIANLAKDQQILQYARDTAIDILKTDAKLELAENYKLKALIQKNNGSSVEWKKIS